MMSRLRSLMQGWKMGLRERWPRASGSHGHHAGCAHHRSVEAVAGARKCPRSPNHPQPGLDPFAGFETSPALAPQWCHENGCAGPLGYSPPLEVRLERPATLLAAAIRRDHRTWISPVAGGRVLGCPAVNQPASAGGRTPSDRPYGALRTRESRARGQ